MQTVVTGATGFIGKALVALLQQQGHQVTTLTRDAEKARPLFGSEVKHLSWKERSHWQRFVADSDVVFHLAGASVAGQRWTPEYKRTIRVSREETTRAIAEACPPVLISASAVGIYGGQGDAILTEESPSGDDFLADVCVRWEAATQPAITAGRRVALVRIGQVLGKGGGTLEAILHPPVVPFSPFQMGVGGTLGDGKQWMPWVHLNDVVRLFLWCAENGAANGPYNAVAPNPVTNREFTETLGKVLHRPTAISVPAFALRALLGEFADYVLYSQRVTPKRTMEQDFTFDSVDIEAVLRTLLSENLTVS